MICLFWWCTKYWWRWFFVKSVCFPGGESKYIRLKILICCSSEIVVFRRFISCTTDNHPPLWPFIPNAHSRLSMYLMISDQMLSSIHQFCLDLNYGKLFCDLVVAWRLPYLSVLWQSHFFFVMMSGSSFSNCYVPRHHLIERSLHNYMKVWNEIYLLSWVEFCMNTPRYSMLMDEAQVQRIIRPVCFVFERFNELWRCQTSTCRM